MSTEVLQTELREGRGKWEARRMRAHGETPAVLYGHKEETVALTLKSDQLHTALRHGAHMVELAGAVKQSAFVRDIQWDALGNEILHVDLTRVDRDEEVEVTLAIELRGVAPGTTTGGVIDHAAHQITVICKASTIPEKIVVGINDLELGQSITVADLDLGGAKFEGDPEMVVVSCVEPIEQPEEEEAAATGAEPEVIGRKEDEEEGDS